MEILLILPGFILAIIIMVIYKIKLRKLCNKVHFYVTKDKYNDRLMLWVGKPRRCAAVWGYTATSHAICYENYFGIFGLNAQVYKAIKWEDEPVEVFLNLED